MMKRSSSSSAKIFLILLFICLISGNEVTSDRDYWGPNSGLCKFTSFPAVFLDLRGGVCKDKECDSACNKMFGKLGLFIKGRCEQLYCACYEICYKLPPRAIQN
ncbi:unnamed protein product [Linum tenue]|uniref:Defensin-like protein n=1 Tax=Linum tenue TaxID=586396 RepID=A0AAV0LH54_9ROSI|nr:unnamed protein product [Linum tenue]